MGEEVNFAGDAACTWNGAVSNASVGDGKYAAILSYFAKAGTYQGRTQEAVNADVAAMFGDEKSTTLKLIWSSLDYAEV